MNVLNRRVYIETTIPSFYYELRPEPDMVSRREWTREWWDDRRLRFELVTSEAVVHELESGASLVTPLELLAEEEES